MSDALCRSQSCRRDEHGGPRRVEPTRPLCRICAERLGENLKKIAEAWPDLRARVAVEGKAGEKITGTKLPGIVINEAVADLIREVALWANQTAGRVLRQHEHTQRPSTHDPGVVLAWLAKYHAWRLAYDDDHDAAVSTAEWAAWYRREVRRVAYPSNARRVDIPDARCRVELRDTAGQLTGLRCGGTLFAIVRDDASLLPSELLCSVDDEHRIPAGNWVQYMRALEKANNAAESM